MDWTIFRKVVGQRAGERTNNVVSPVVMQIDGLDIDLQRSVLLLLHAPRPDRCTYDRKSAADHWRREWQATLAVHRMAAAASIRGRRRPTKA